MLIFAIDDEPKALRVLCRCVEESAPGAELRAFDKAADALDAIRTGGLSPDIVFSDIEMPGASGLEFAVALKNVALQIAAGSPPSYVAKEDVPQSVIDEEKAVLIKQAKNDPKNAGKPDAILEKMVGGRLGKFYQANCLLEQEYVKDDSLTVGKYLAGVSKTIGGEIKIDSFVIFEKGEGLEKREEDFASEIAKMVNKD